MRMEIDHIFDYDLKYGKLKSWNASDDMVLYLWFNKMIIYQL